MIGPTGPVNRFLSEVLFDPDTAPVAIRLQNFT